MKKQIRLTENELKQIIVETIINEGFWNNLQGAIQGAYGGYQARKGYNDRKSNMDKNRANPNSKYYNQGTQTSYQRNTQDGLVDGEQISKAINQLYTHANWFATEWSKKGWSSTKTQSYLNKIENDIQQIKISLGNKGSDGFENFTL